MLISSILTRIYPLIILPLYVVLSLPTTVDHAELSARLKEHLSAYVEVNFVRIIRDNRGGVCAFVQCNVSILTFNRISPHISV